MDGKNTRLNFMVFIIRIIILNSQGTKELVPKKFFPQNLQNSVYFYFCGLALIRKKKSSPPPPQKKKIFM